MAELMKGKRGLVMGVANDRSIAWGIAKAVHAQGAEIAVTYQGDALLKRVRPLAEQLGHSLFDGQLYFSGVAQLALVAPWSLFAAVAFVLLSRHLLLARVYPDYFTARRLRAWPVVLGFDLLAALTLALATMTMGVMGGFALVFVPAWIAFRRARSWRKGMLLAVVIGVAGYGAAFLLALGLDQPFGPVLALLLIAVGLIIA